MSLTMAKPCFEESPKAPAGRDDLPCPQWYAAYIQPRHEKVVAKQLTLREVETYLPLYQEIRRWNGRQTKIDRPLFSGYVFVRVQLAERLKVLEHPSVISFVSFNGCPAPLPQSDIDRLRNSLAQRQAEPFPYLVAGKRVRINGGPLSGLEGTILRRKGKVRMIVSIDFLQRSIAVNLEAADLCLAA